MKIAPLLLFFCISLSLLSQKTDVFLLRDNFENMSLGTLMTDVGAHLEYHYLPEARNVGNWAVATFHYNLPPSWFVRQTDNGKLMFQKEFFIKIM